MNRSFNEIQQSILEAKAAAVELNALEITTTSEQSLEAITSTSKVSIWRRIVWIIAYAIWIHEQIVTKNAENSRPHTIRWYIEQCLNFHDGFSLQWINGQFSYSSDATEESKIIKRVAVLESNDGELVVKVATDNAGDISPLSNPQLSRFTDYLNLIKDAGNRIRIINQQADQLRLTLDVHVDISIIEIETGKLLNVAGDVFPVKDALDKYLQSLEFNGAFVKEFLKDELKLAEGVKIPLIQQVEWKYADFDWATFGEWKIPEAGYFKIEPENLTINYIAYDLANG